MTSFRRLYSCLSRFFLNYVFSFLSCYKWYVFFYLGLECLFLYVLRSCCSATTAGWTKYFDEKPLKGEQRYVLFFLFWWRLYCVTKAFLLSLFCPRRERKKFKMLEMYIVVFLGPTIFIRFIVDKFFLSLRKGRPQVHQNKY